MIMLLNSLEALSHDHSLVGDEFASLEYSMVCVLLLAPSIKILLHYNY
jgi:hypothetical protein